MPPEFPKDPTAAEMRAVLAYHQISRDELAEALGIDRSSVWRRLSGRVKWRALEVEAVRKMIEGRSEA